MTKTQGVFIGLVAILLFVFLFLYNWGEFQDQFSTQRIASWLTEAGPWAPLLFIGSMVAAVVISPIPSLPLDLAAGAAFGPFLGTVYAVIGAEIGAIISFLLSRTLGREFLTKLLRTNIVFCEKCSDHHFMLVLILARLLPIFSFDVISYGAGLTNISLKTFALATLIGMIPPTFALTYLGNSFISSQLPLVFGGFVMVGFFLAIPKLVLRYPNTWWARWFLAASPSSTQLPSDHIPPNSSTKSDGTCAGCESSLPENHVT